MQTLGLSAAAGALSTAVEQRTAEAQEGTNELEHEIVGPDAVEITLRINGKDQKVTIEPSMTLMEALRWNLRMTGTKEVCDRGACGGCSVLINGELIVSCMLLAMDAVGAEITTIEGVADGDTLDPIQEAFIKHDALQCGYCTPGLVLASKALLNKNPKPTLDDIKHGLSGNICRCGTYTTIFNAVLEASGQKPILNDGMMAGDAQ
jgi:aerobic-type carbon monoxide dehydrogenase small subunit (CoxS/CutS family)